MRTDTPSTLWTCTPRERARGPNRTTRVGGIVEPGLSRFWAYGEPDPAWNLERELVELKGGDEADDPFGYQLRNLGEIMRRRDFGIGEPVKATGDADESPVLEHARECFRVDAGVAELDAAHEAAGLEKGGSPILLRYREGGRHVNNYRLLGRIVRHYVTILCGGTGQRTRPDQAVSGQ